MKRYLGIDYGHARIGLATGDDEIKIAHPLTTLEKQSDPLRALAEIIQQQAIDTIVLGLPRGLQGQDTIQTGAIRSFAAVLKGLNRPIIMHDEAATSILAKERLNHKPHDKAAVDMEAAAIILQDYLDSL